MKPILSNPSIVQKIFLIRGEKVILDRDLAALYDVEVRALNQTVRRNIERFPSDFMFQLNTKEFQDLKSHFVTSSWGGVRKMPLAFTEQGVAMLSGLLNSKSAIKVNIEIMRAFVQLRKMIDTNKKFAVQLKELESKITVHDKQIAAVFEAIKELMIPPEPEKRKIGF
ncbi:MAG: ORF6N domain-containing protein [Bacteroidota bacterium]|jgi:hypothetical protein